MDIWDPKTDELLQKNVSIYLQERQLMLGDDAVYDILIDGVDILVSGHAVLRVGLPPVSNYSIHETEHTNKYLLKVDNIAV